MEHQILERETVCKGKAFSMGKYRIQLPDGRECRYDIALHGPAVVVVPVTADGKILFVRQYRIGAEKQLLEIPAGVINAGEDPDPAAERELREETGYESGDMLKLGGFYMAAGYSTEYLHIYLARDLKWNPLPQDDDEFLSPVSLPIEEAYQMAETSAFEDSKTFAALMMAQKYIRNSRQ